MDYSEILLLHRQATRVYADAMRDKQYDVARQAALKMARYSLELNKYAANAVLAQAVRYTNSMEKI